MVGETIVSDGSEILGELTSEELESNGRWCCPERNLRSLIKPKRDRRKPQ
jgi:hypothetical protein